MARYKAETHRARVDGDIADTVFGALTEGHDARTQQDFDTETPYNPYAPAYGYKVAEVKKTAIIYTGQKVDERKLPSGAETATSKVYLKYGKSGTFSKSGAVVTFVRATRPDGSAHDGGLVTLSVSVFDENEDEKVRDVIGAEIASLVNAAANATVLD